MSRNETPSALASLTATYTDSEEGEEEEETKVVAITQPFHLPASPLGNSNSHDGNSASNSSETRKRNPLGLVSYQDDAMDDDTIDGNQSDGDRSPNTIITEESEQSDISNEDINIENNEDIPNPRVRIPPEPQGKCSNESLQRVAKLFEKKRGGMDMNKYIQCNKNFRNPSIYEKLIHLCHIDELGTNYPRDIYDPHFWGETSYYDELAKVQKTEMERREKDKKERTKIEFQSGMIKKPTSTTQNDGESKKKSKWDQRGVMPPLSMPMPTVQPIVQFQPNISSSATGTRGTVINAFGNLPKKSK